MTSISSARTGTGAATGSTPPITHPAHSLLLSRAHSPETAARIFTDKIKNKPLFLSSSAATSTDKDKRALRRHIRLRKKEYYLRKRRPKPLSAREKRDLGVFDLKREEVRYDVYKGLHGLWNDYMLEILGYLDPRRGDVQGKGRQGQDRNQGLDLNETQNQTQAKGKGKQQSGPASSSSSVSSKTIAAQSHGSFLASADFHGAEVEVVRCADPGRVGTKGIVVRDTKFTFVVVTPNNQVRTLPKKNSVFRYHVTLPDSVGATSVSSVSDIPRPDCEEGGEGQELQTQPRRLVFEVHGNQFEFRPAERANRKFKWKAMDDL